MSAVAQPLDFVMSNLIVLIVVVVCAIFGGTIAVKGWASRFHRRVAVLSFAAASLCVGEWLVALEPTHWSLGVELCFISELLLVVMLFDAVTILDRDSDRSRLGRSYLPAIIATGMGLWISVVVMRKPTPPMEGFNGGLGLPEDLSYLFSLLLYAVSIAYIEALLRTLRDPILYQLKFVLIGLMALAGFRIFTVSQTIFNQGHRLDAAASGGAILIAIALMAYGFIRARFQSFAEQISLSPKVLHGSLTFLVVGFYLFMVGVMGQIVRSLGVPSSVAFSVLLVWLALVGLVVFLFSRSARTALRTIVARNFFRSKYDYRAQWLEVTEVFRDCDSVDTIWDRLLRLLSRTFYANRISVWHKSNTDGRFHQVRSTNTEAPPAPLDASHEVIRQLAEQDVPIAVDTIELPLHDSFVQATGAVLCAPIHASDELIGFIALSDEVAGLPYGQDDRDLLKAIAHHVGVLLAHAQLAEERQGSAELEALHRFSAFCLHDLKNLAARLSLVVQNAEHHGQDPAFQESAMRTVRDTTHKMMALMGKLSRKSVKPPHAGTPGMVELLELINEVVASLTSRTVRWHVTAEMVRPVRVVREEIYQVFLNVLLNAKQAIGEEGDIWIALSQVEGSVVVTVQDTGCGIPRERMLSLFRPAQTSRPGGLGIGLYQCKQIIEAHRGTIQIRSEVGQGTLVRIELPLSVPSVVLPCEVSAQTTVSL